MEEIDAGHFERTDKPLDDPRIGQPCRPVRRAGPWVQVQYDNEAFKPRWWHESWLNLIRDADPTK